MQSNCTRAGARKSARNNSETLTIHPIAELFDTLSALSSEMAYMRETLELSQEADEWLIDMGQTIGEALCTLTGCEPDNAVPLSAASALGSIAVKLQKDGQAIPVDSIKSDLDEAHMQLVGWPLFQQRSLKDDNERRETALNLLVAAGQRLSAGDTEGAEAELSSAFVYLQGGTCIKPDGNHPARRRFQRMTRPESVELSSYTMILRGPRGQVHRYLCGCVSLHDAGDSMPLKDADCPRCNGSAARQR